MACRTPWNFFNWLFYSLENFTTISFCTLTKMNLCIEMNSLCTDYSHISGTNGVQWHYHFALMTIYDIMREQAIVHPFTLSSLWLALCSTNNFDQLSVISFISLIKESTIHELHFCHPGFSTLHTPILPSSQWCDMDIWPWLDVQDPVNTMPMLLKLTSFSICVVSQAVGSTSCLKNHEQRITNNYIGDTEL